MLNAFAKVFNRMPKENSKTQKKKAAEKKPEFAKCCKCSTSGVTLYRENGEWFCKKHRPEPVYEMGILV